MLTSPALVSSALADDVKLEAVTVTDHDVAVLFRTIEVKDSNLSTDDVRKLFSLTTPVPEQADLIARMSASSLSIPDIQVSLKGGTINLTGFQMTDIKAGKVGTLVLTQATGQFTSPDGLPASAHANALLVEGADFAGALAALKNQDVSDVRLRFSHIKWDGFDLAFADKDTLPAAAGGNQWRVQLAGLEGSSTFDGDVPLKAEGALKSLRISAPPASKEGRALAQYGYDQLDFGMSYAGLYDPAAKNYTLGTYEVHETKSGALTLHGEFGALDPGVFTGSKDAKLALAMNANIRSLSLKFDNAGLFEKVLTSVATQQGVTPDTLRKQMLLGATQFLPLVLGSDPSALELATAINAFLAHPTSLTVSATAKDEPLRVTEIIGAQDNPLRLLKRVQLHAVTAP